MLLSYTIYKVHGWFEELNNFRKKKNNPANIPTISATIPMNILQRQTKQLPDSDHFSSTSKRTVPMSTPNSINAILPGQIPTDETPEPTEPNYAQPSTSHSCTTKGPAVLPIKLSNIAHSPESSIATSNITSTVDPDPSNSTQAVPLGNILNSFFKQDQTNLNISL